MLLMLAIAFIGCGGETTTGTPTTVAPTTEGPTTATPTTGTPTTEGPTTEAPTTEEPSNTVPQFVGLFPKQTVYKGSQSYDILAGAKAIDAEDGELEIMTAGAFSTTRVGTYEVYAYAQDSDGNVITELITLTVKDLTAYAIPTELTSDPITIELWHSNGDTIEAALKKYALEFSEIHPNVTVTITKNGNNYDELRENMVNAIRGGTIPNIIQNYPDHVMEYVNNNGLISLTPYIYHPVHGFNPEVVEESFQDILLSYRRENSQYTTDGEYYSLPFNKSTEVMIYNKTMFDMLIANGTITEIPTTWQGLFALTPAIEAIKDDLIDDITAKLNDPSANPAWAKTPEEIQAIKDNFVPISYDSPANAFITLTRQWGGQYTTIDSARNGVVLFDNPQTRAMLSYFFDNRDTTFTLPGVWSGADYASDYFKVGQTAITFGSTGGARYNTPNIVNGEFVFEFGVAPMPYNADLPGERTAIQQGTNMSVTTAGTDQQKLASWLFLKFLASKEVQLDFALITGYSPVRSTVYDEAIYDSFREGKELVYNETTDTWTATENQATGEMLMKSLVANAAAQQANFLFYDQAFIGSSTARAEVEALFERVILGSLEGTTKEEIINSAIAAAVANVNRILE